MQPTAKFQSKMTVEQMKVLEFIFRNGWDSGEWPKYGLIRRPLSREGVDAASTLASLIPIYVKGSGGNSVIQDHETVRLTLRGLNEVEGGAMTVIPVFLDILRYFVAREQNYEPDSVNLQPTVKEAEVAEHLAQNRPDHVAKALASKIKLILLDETGHWSMGSSIDANGHWAVTLSSKISEYKDIRTIQDYLRINPFYALILPTPFKDDVAALAKHPSSPNRFVNLWKGIFNRSISTTRRVSEVVVGTVIGGLILTYIAKKIWR